MTHHVPSLTMTIIKNSNNKNSHYNKNPTKQVFPPKTTEGAVEAGISTYCWWECKNGTAAMETAWKFLQKSYKTELPYDLGIPLRTPPKALCRLRADAPQI